MSIGATAINTVILMGRLTADPELRQTAGGISSCSFTIAVTRAYPNQNGERESDFIRCQAWRQTAEFISRNFCKGKLILVEGNLRTGSYDDKTHPDVKHYTTDVYVDQAGFGETKGSSDAQGQPRGQTYQQQAQSQPYQQQYRQAAPAAPSNTLTPEDFEEVISDGGQLPF